MVHFLLFIRLLAHICHFLVETDLITYTEDRNQGTRTRTTGLIVPNMKVGLTNNTDIQLVFTPHLSQETLNAGQTERRKGWGDSLIRLKYNLIGNDGGDFAAAVMPFVKLPTNTNDLGNNQIEGGVIFPFAVALPSDWAMGLMFQFNRNKNESNKNYHTEFISSITFGHDIIGDLAGYFEFFSEASDDSQAQWVATFDTGLTYALTPDIQLDAGVNWALTDAADDINPFIGISTRF